MKPSIRISIILFFLISLSFSALAQVEESANGKRILSDQTKELQANRSTTSSTATRSNANLRPASKSTKKSASALKSYNKMTTEEKISSIEQAIVREHQLQKRDMEVRIEKFEKLLEELKIKKQRE